MITAAPLRLINAPGAADPHRYERITGSPGCRVQVAGPAGYPWFIDDETGVINRRKNKI